MEIIAETKCNNCGELLTEEWLGWYEIGLTEFGLEIKVPICNQCNLSDDGGGAY
jgi:hypothetical protein